MATNEKRSSLLQAEVIEMAHRLRVDCNRLYAIARDKTVRTEVASDGARRAAKLVDEAIDEIQFVPLNNW